MGQIFGPGAVPDLDGRAHPVRRRPRGSDWVGAPPGGLDPALRPQGPAQPRQFASGPSHGGLAGIGAGARRRRSGGDYGWRRRRRSGGQMSGGNFWGDRLNRGVRLGWNRGRQTGDGRFRRWGLGYPGRRGSGFGPPGIHGARKASPGMPRPGSFWPQRPQHLRLPARAGGPRPGGRDGNRGAPGCCGPRRFLPGSRSRVWRKQVSGPLGNDPPGNKRSIDYWLKRHGGRAG